MRSLRVFAPTTGLLFALAACGGSASTAPATTAASTAGDEAVPLDAPTAVPGTGVRLRTPRGSEPMMMGAGFLHTARRVQIVVAEADGPPALHEAFRENLAREAEELETEEVTIAGRPTTLIIDRQANGQLALERVWFVIEDGTRIAALAGAYEAGRSERARPVVRAALLSAEWDPSVPLDPEAAIGFRLTPPESLVLDRTTISGVAYKVAGDDAGPLSGAPNLYLAPIPIPVPESERAQICEELLLEAGPVQADWVEARDTLTAAGITGCEVSGTIPPTPETPEGAPAIDAYAALVFRGPLVFMVAGTVASAEAATWLPRFHAAALTIDDARPHGE